MSYYSFINHSLIIFYKLDYDKTIFYIILRKESGNSGFEWVSVMGLRRGMGPDI